MSFPKDLMGFCVVASVAGVVNHLKKVEDLEIAGHVSGFVFECGMKIVCSNDFGAYEPLKIERFPETCPRGLAQPCACARAYKELVEGAEYARRKADEISDPVRRPEEPSKM